MVAKLKILNATVKYPVGKKFPTKFGSGNRVNVVLVGENGAEYTIWSDENDVILNVLQKGQSVQLIEDDKGKYSVVETPELARQIEQHTLLHSTHETEAQDRNFSAPELIDKVYKFKPWTPEERKIIATQVSQNADLLAHCLKTSHEKFANPAQPLVHEEESIRALAIALFAQAMREFSN
jgi:hypothetical protein